MSSPKITYTTGLPRSELTSMTHLLHWLLHSCEQNGNYHAFPETGNLALPIELLDDANRSLILKVLQWEGRRVITMKALGAQEKFKAANAQQLKNRVQSYNLDAPELKLAVTSQTARGRTKPSSARIESRSINILKQRLQNCRAFVADFEKQLPQALNGGNHPALTISNPTQGRAMRSRPLLIRSRSSHIGPLDRPEPKS